MAEAVPIDKFIMHGARAALASGMVHIDQQIRAIEEAVVSNPALAFDLAKTLIESACRTILTERNVGFEAADDLPKLFRTATRGLPVLPVSASGEAEVRKSLLQTLNGLHTAVLGVCALRNACGFASHGSDRPRPALEAVQALLVAETADTIVGFLYRAHCQDRTPLTSTIYRYEDNDEFNAYVDEAHDSVHIFEEDFQPSRILFEVAPVAYRLHLAEYAPEEDAEESA